MPSRQRFLVIVFLLIVAASLMAQAPATKAPPKTAGKPAATAAAGTTTLQPSKLFPYKIVSRTLPNGLTVIVIPAPEFKDMVTYATPVFAGSRNETEKGKTGLAHLFEHIMFRHEYGGKEGGYEEMMRRMGADNNAWTDYDLTFYHPTTFSANLVGPVQTPGGPIPGLIELEASRFQHLTMQKKTFQVEAGAVLGEYRRTFSFPSEKAVEVLSPIAFPHHPYGHTVMGYYEDVVNMPNAWDNAWTFYHNYYAPNDVAIVVVGDVNPETIFANVAKFYGDWKPTRIPAIPAEQEPTKTERVHVNWDADVSPRLLVGYHTPAMHPGAKETAVQMILAELLMSRSAPLYQKLRYEKQTVTDIGFEGGDEFLASTDPHLMLIDAELVADKFKAGGNGYVDDVQKDIVDGVNALKTFSKQPNAAQTLAVIKSKIRNDYVGGLDSTMNVATAYSWMYRFDRKLNVFSELAAALDALTPADIDAYAGKYFTPERMVITTLWHGPENVAAQPKEGK